MKTIKLFFLLPAVLLLPLFSSAQVTTETRTVSGFTGIRTTSVIKVELTQADADAVVVEGTADDIKNVKTEVQDGILSITTNGNPKGEDGIKVKVSVKNLRMLDVSGASETSTTNKLTIDSLHIIGSGASSMKLDVQAGAIKTTLSGASNLKLTGTTSKLEAQLSGASSLKAYQLVADKVTVATSGAASAHVAPTASMNATSSGASEIHYQGNPADKTVNSSGASSITNKDSNGTAANDTTSIRVGKYDVHVTENDDDERSKREKHADNSDFEFWQGLDIGVNGLLTADNKTTLPPAFDFLELNYA
ncbi:MAG TPA: head GIN domain-containing protein, partial [Bacteroidia bacterium]|nr:head GIN domain-containing protein [Bacteroidia bacterium]